MHTFRHNHYVTEWYQRRFIPATAKERKFYYLDKSPDWVVENGHRHQRAALLRWGPDWCFAQTDLYTTRFGEAESTAIEQQFFGPVDQAGMKAVEYFAQFSHPAVDGEAMQDLLLFMSLQKLRTPKGLAYLAELVNLRDRNRVLFHMQQLQQLFCAIWTESVWVIADASASATKFIVSDHPVTVYNKGCFPASQWCQGHKDPDIRLSGTHTLFPLNLEKILILTNLSWARNPYTDPRRKRPNPALFHQAIFNFQEIQTGRVLSEQDVLVINRIIKERAYRYVAAAEKAWLYPERQTGSMRWDRMSEPYVLMPDPRSMQFSTQMVFGGKNWAQAFDEYGHQPGQPGFDDKARQQQEWDTFHGFKGEYARIFGPRRRGRTFQFGGLEQEEDDPEFHKYHLGLEAKFKPSRRWKR